MVEIFIKGLLIGVLVSAPMGPVGMLCIRRTFYKGRWHGFMTGLGATLSDICYGILTALGMGFVVNFVEANQTPLQVMGSIVLGLFGYYIYQSNPAKILQKPSTKHKKKRTYTQDFFTAFLLTFSNVLIVLLYIGLYARFGFILPEHPVSMVAIGMLGIAVGAIAWWFTITSLFAKLGTMINVRRIGLLNRLIGIIVLCLAAIGIASALFTTYFRGPLLLISLSS